MTESKDCQHKENWFDWTRIEFVCRDCGKPLVPKDVQDVPAKELNPCPGCGEPMFLTQRQTMKPPMLVCQNDINCHFSVIEILPREYEKSYCWKKLAKAKEQLSAKEKEIARLKFLCAVEVTSDLLEENRELESRVKSLTEAVNKYGEHENSCSSITTINDDTELMIKKEDCDCWIAEAISTEVKE